MSETPTLDKFALHPNGGYCTCFTRPYSVCVACLAVRESAERWNTLSSTDLKLAEAELKEAYPRTSNQDGR